MRIISTIPPANGVVGGVALGHTFATRIVGNYAYVADYEGGLEITDVSDPQAPHIVGSYKGETSSDNVLVSGRYAYLANFSTGVTILDISIPSSPAFVGSYALGSGDATSLALSGNILFVNDQNSSAVRVLDVTNPAAPSLVATYVTAGGNGQPTSVTLQGSYLYVTDFAGALYILDISNPASPSLTGSYTVGLLSPTETYIADGLAYVADLERGLFILNVTNPAAPSLIGRYNPGGIASYSGVQVINNRAYLADHSGAVTVLDVTNPASPALVDTLSVGVAPRNVLAAGNYLYLSDDINGLVIIDPTTVVPPPKNQAPTIDLGHSSLSGTVSEVLNTTGSTKIDSVSGTIAFSDPDNADRPTASILAESVSYRNAQGALVALPSSVSSSVLQDAFTLADRAGNTNTGAIDWSYKTKDSTLDFLGAGEVLKIISTVAIDDHKGGGAAQDVTVTINGANDSPTAVADTKATTRGAKISVAAAQGVLANDHDPDAHDTLTVSAVNGSTAAVGSPIIGKSGTLTLNSDGGYTYTANKSSVGSSSATDQFSYSVSDGHGGIATSTLAITVSNPMPPMLSIRSLDADKNEGNSGSTPFTFEVTRTGDMSKATSVRWTAGVNQDPAANKADFVGNKFPTGTLTFAAGDTSPKLITVNVQGDTAVESGALPEAFQVSLSKPTAGATIDPLRGSALAHIHDDDLAPFLARLSKFAYDPTVPSGLIPGFRTLSHTDLPSIPVVAKSGSSLGGGIYEDGNAAALVGVTSDSLFIAFRGTVVDNGIINPLDEFDWFHMVQHYALYADLISATDKYVSDHSQIKNVYITGHSLGASMAQAYMNEAQHSGSMYQAITFGSPGYEAFGVHIPDARIVNLQIKHDIVNDVVGIANAFGLPIHQERGTNVTFNDSETTTTISGLDLHNIDAYSAATASSLKLGYQLPTSDGQNLIGDILYNPLMHPSWSFLAPTGTIHGTDGNDWIIAGAGSNTLIGGKGDDILTGGGGSSTFVFQPNLGRDVITNFAPGRDVIRFDGVFGNFATLASHMAADGQGNTVIRPTGSGSVTMQNVNLASLHAADFRFQ